MSKRINPILTLQRKMDARHLISRRKTSKAVKAAKEGNSLHSFYHHLYSLSSILPITTPPPPPPPVFLRACY